ncbi:MAG: hypothetical protein AAGC77_07430 [Pseudomonadota bacterium]
MQRIALAVVALALGACASIPPDDVSDACEIFDDKGGWYDATDDAEERWGLPKHIQLAIIGRESGFDADAKPERRRFLLIFPGARKSSARGYPQAIEQTWELYQRLSGNDDADRRSFRDSADFVAWYGAQSRRRLGLSMDDAYSHYLAYHEGWDGYARRSFESKGWLLQAAGSVSATAATYRRQLDRCEKRFRRGIPLIPFI